MLKTGPIAGTYNGDLGLIGNNGALNRVRKEIH
jgi:hypothetical protein